eukprot:9500789-Pyramimonas_sp.AAC.1
MVSWAFLREFARLGIDPLQHVISWESRSLSPAMFLRLISTRNQFRHDAPSFHQAVFGRNGDLALSMHSHNWFHTDDAWFKSVGSLVG